MSASRLPAPHGPSLLRNPLSFLGWMIATVSFFTGLVLIVTDIIWFSENVYNGIITYMIVPAFLFSGLALVAVGVILEWRRRRRAGLVPEEQRFPHLDLNLPRHRKVLTTIIVATTLVVAISAVGGYQAYHFTESVTFCGEACHKVMTPEFTAYQGSPHARVTCVQCHIGPGANAYVKSKASGLRQVWKYNLDTFELPVAVPIANLRPARETCEQCHWPEKFSGDFKRVFWYFAADEENTARAFHLLMKVGGASTDTGRVGGIHWHVSREDKVEYWASDAKRTSIPWVRVTYADGRSRVYRTRTRGEPPAEEIRTMDCMDCHNRPSHIYYSPKTSLQKALVSGRLDRRIPRLYGTALELLSENYPDSRRRWPPSRRACARSTPTRSPPPRWRRPSPNCRASIRTRSSPSRGWTGGPIRTTSATCIIPVATAAMTITGRAWGEHLQRLQPVPRHHRAAVGGGGVRAGPLRGAAVRASGRGRLGGDAVQRLPRGGGADALHTDAGEGQEGSGRWPNDSRHLRRGHGGRPTATVPRRLGASPPRYAPGYDHAPLSRAARRTHSHRRQSPVSPVDAARTVANFRRGMEARSGGCGRKSATVPEPQALGVDRGRLSIRGP
ncbi:NapC/NirT family cytochrome c [bacterium]|nr:NapC/NirT family cytochrome c [bacterium]